MLQFASGEAGISIGSLLSRRNFRCEPQASQGERRKKERERDRGGEGETKGEAAVGVVILDRTLRFIANAKFNDARVFS